MELFDVQTDASQVLFDNQYYHREPMQTERVCVSHELSPLTVVILLGTDISLAFLINIKLCTCDVKWFLTKQPFRVKKCKSLGRVCVPCKRTDSIGNTITHVRFRHYDIILYFMNRPESRTSRGESRICRSRFVAKPFRRKDTFSRSGFDVAIKKNVLK